MKKRIFSKVQKLAILKEASKQGINKTLEKHKIYPTTYYSWKKKYEELGEEGLVQGATERKSKEQRKLEEENQRLRKLLQEKELERRLLERTRQKD